MRYNRVLVTGISGVGSATALQALVESVSTKQVARYDVGQKIIDLAKDQGFSLTAESILNAPPSLLKALRHGVLQELLAKLESNTQQSHLLDIHATFMTTSGLIEGLSFKDTEKLHPDLFITVVDGPQDIQERLKSGAAGYFHLTVSDIVKWQEIEVYVTHLLAEACEGLHFVVPTRDATTTLHKLIFSEDEGIRDPLPVYVSYPMTNLPAEQKPLRDRFLEMLRARKDLIVFDPGAIESSHNVRAYHTPEDRRSIGAHTIVRDLNWMIGINSKAVVAYMTLDSIGKGRDPRVIPSSGSNDELMYAYQHGLDTYLVIERKAGDKLPPLSPFTTYKARLFVTPEDFFEYLDLSEQEQAAHDVVSSELALHVFTSKRHAAGNNHRDGGGEADKERFIKEADRLCKYHLPENACKSLSEAGKLRSVAAKLYALWSEPEGPPQLRLPIES